MFSEPVVGEKFFGRNEVLELLQKRVMALRDGYRQNIAFTGHSLAGKSSIILHFLSMIKDEGFIPVYVEVVNEPFKTFANKFIATMLYNSLAKMGENAGVYLSDILNKAQKVLPKTFSEIRRVNSYIDRADYDEAYAILLGLTSVLKEETGLSCIVILDEFDNLELLGIKNPFLSFGKVIMVQKDTMYIVSSSRNNAIRKILSEKLSLLFGNFEIIRVANFDVRTAVEFIETKLGGFEISESIKKFLVAFTDGNPFYLDRIVAGIKSQATDRMSNNIDADLLCEVVLHLVYDANGSIHGYLSNYILDLLDTRYRDNYISILIAIANGQNKQAEIARMLKTKMSEVSKYLLRLSELGLVTKNGIFYKIDDAMLAFWIKHVYQKRREILINGTFDRMAIFADDFKAYLKSFVADLERDIDARLSDLFNIFGNELVLLDSKNMRLPHFTKVEIKSFTDGKSVIACSFRCNYWIMRSYETCANENDIIDYIRNVKSLGCKVSNKVIIPLKGMDENAKLLAKELKISIWDYTTVNMLFGLFGKRGVV